MAPRLNPDFVALAAGVPPKLKVALGASPVDAPPRLNGGLCASPAGADPPPELNVDFVASPPVGAGKPNSGFDGPAAAPPRLNDGAVVLLASEVVGGFEPKRGAEVVSEAFAPKRPAGAAAGVVEPKRPLAGAGDAGAASGGFIPLPNMDFGAWVAAPPNIEAPPCDGGGPAGVVENDRGDALGAAGVDWFAVLPKGKLEPDVAGALAFPALPNNGGEAAAGLAGLSSADFGAPKGKALVLGAALPNITLPGLGVLLVAALPKRGEEALFFAASPAGPVAEAAPAPPNRLGEPPALASAGFGVPPKLKAEEVPPKRGFLLSKPEPKPEPEPKPPPELKPPPDILVSI